MNAHPGLPDEERTTAREDGLRILLDDAADLLAIRDAGDLATALFSRLSAHLQCDVMTNFCLEGDRLRLLASAGLPEAVVESLRVIELAAMPCGTCAASGERVYMPAAALLADPRTAGLHALGVRAYACTPLVSQGRVIGTYAFASTQRSAFTAADLELMSSAGHFATVALERVRAEDKVRSSEERFRTLVDHAADGIYLHDASGFIIDANTQACRSVDRPREELVGKPVTCIDPAVGETEIARMIAELERGNSLAFDSLHARRDGSRFPVEVRLRPFWNGGRRFAIAIVRDITERKRAEAAIRQSEETLRRALAIARLGSWVFDPATATLTLSEPAAEILGCAATRLTEDEFMAAVHAEDRSVLQPTWNRARSGEAGNLEVRISAQGQLRWVGLWVRPELEGGQLMRITGVVQDITARRQLEEQVRQTGKMEALGILAGGIAHDFNNLLTVITGFGEELHRAQKATAEQRDFAGKILQAAERATLLTRQLLAFGRKQVMAPVVADLGQIVTDAASLLRRVIGEHIALSTNQHEVLWSVRVDPGQIEQVLMNLVVNSRDAMPDGGRIAIELRNRELGAAAAAAHQGVRPGRYVSLTVTDTGTGIAPAVRERLFEPFFTTKSPGKGTGLGLATVYGIVTQTGGHVAIDSTVGVGTRFEVLLPAVDAKAVAIPALPPHAREHGEETILLVEDEDRVREIAKRALEGRGYRVIEANHGKAALQIASEHRGRIDLLLTDVVMPELGGRLVATTLRASRPELRVLYMSGHSDDALLREGVFAATDAFLHKPFAPRDLALKVRSLLDARTADGPRQPVR